MAVPTHLIKKYANRKLYDTLTSRYVTLGQISQLVRQGHEIQVVERDTGRDITALVLSQVLMGEERRRPSAETVQERGQALLGYLRRSLRAPAARVGSEVEKRRAEVEELVDTAVGRALARLSIPTRREVAMLGARVEELERRVERVLGSSGPDSQAARSPAAKRASRTRVAGARRWPGSPGSPPTGSSPT